MATLPVGVAGRRGDGVDVTWEVSAFSSEVDSVWLEHGGTFQWISLVGS